MQIEKTRPTTKMEDNIKISELKSKKQKRKILNFLDKLKVKNLYLLEGLSIEKPNTKSILFSNNDHILSVAHVVLNRYIHIQCFTHNRSLKLELGEKIKKIFPEIISIFGDKNSVEFFTHIYHNRKYKTLKYYFLELDKSLFSPVNFSAYHGISSENFVVKPENLSEILSLQISYEIEELELEPSKIKREILARVIENRIRREEMTVLKINDKAVGIAAINAKYRNVCQIGSVYIDKNYRGKGYSKLLLSVHLENLFKSYSKIVLFVRKDNKVAYNLYKKLGFNFKGELEQLILK